MKTWFINTLKCAQHCWSCAAALLPKLRCAATEAAPLLLKPNKKRQRCSEMRASLLKLRCCRSCALLLLELRRCFWSRIKSGWCRAALPLKLPIAEHRCFWCYLTLKLRKVDAATVNTVAESSRHCWSCADVEAALRCYWSLELVTRPERSLVTHPDFLNFSNSWIFAF